jgi:hypothetical protein
MFGWWIVISKGHAEDAMVPKESILASWEVGVSGLSWLNDLVLEGKAKKLSDDCYPTRYEARASDVFPLVNSGNASATAHIGQIRDLKLQPERIKATSQDHVLTIDAWDQS